MPTEKCAYAVNSVESGGVEKYLVMTEVSQHVAYDEQVLADATQMASFDAICYLYDSADPNSFGHIVGVIEKHPEIIRIPSIFIATKSDLDCVSQRHAVQPDEYCKSLRLPAPIAISSKDAILADVFQAILAAAVDPSTAVPPSFTNKYLGRILAATAAVGVASLTVAALALIYMRRFKK